MCFWTTPNLCMGLSHRRSSCRLLLALAILAVLRGGFCFAHGSEDARYGQAMGLPEKSLALYLAPDGTDYALNAKALQQAIDDCAANGWRLVIPKGTYKISGRGINLPDNSCIQWDKEAWIFPQNASRGSWFTNLRRETAAGSGGDGRGRKKITLINPQIDGRDIDVHAADYKGDNGMGFAGGYDVDASGISLGTFSTVSGVYIKGGTIRNFLANFVRGGPGGKALNFEEGVEDCVVEDLTASHCTYACLASPTTSDPNKFVRRVTFANIKADHCGSLFYYIGDDGNSTEAVAPPVSPDLSYVVFSGSGYCVGHFPDRVNAGNHEKSAPIVIAAGSNVYVDATITNPPGFPSALNPGGGTLFPTGYPSMGSEADKNRVGAGLAGPIGAVVWGWGVNCRIRVDYTGDCDDTVRLQRSRANGCDRYPANSKNTKPYGAFNFDVTVGQNGAAGTPLRFGQVGLTNTLAPHAAVADEVFLPESASVRDGEYVGLTMWLTAPDGKEVERLVTGYTGLAQGNLRAVQLETIPNGSASDGEPILPKMPFKLGSTHAADPCQISGRVSVKSGVTTTVMNPVTKRESQVTVGRLTLNPAYLQNARKTVYPKYPGVLLSFPER